MNFLTGIFMWITLSIFTVNRTETGFMITADFLNETKTALPVEGQKPRVYCLGERHTKMLSDLLQKGLIHHKINVEIQSSAHVQPELDFMEENGAFRQFNPDFVLFSWNETTMREQFYGHVDHSDWAERQFSRVQHLFKTIKGTLILENCISFPDGISGIGALSNPESFAFQISKLNELLRDFAVQTDHVLLLDKALLASEMGLSAIQNHGMKWLLSMPYTMDFEANVAWSAARLIAAKSGKMKKCLVLDLDNTVWGGVIGDDGMDGIQLSGNAGRPYLEVQRWAKQLKERGVLLAVNSKNEQSIAEEVFRKHPEMQLRLEDIAVFIANWNPKDDNLKTIQQKLNIGFDSMVFVDDNPVEREWIRTSLPEVTVPELPTDPNQYISFLHALQLFDTDDAGEMDRTAHFRQNDARETAREQSQDLNAFLKNLELKAVIRCDETAHSARISELSLRTNQFNFTGLRYTKEEIEARMQQENFSVISVQLKDRFGDYGIIAFMILEWQSDCVVIENWCLSCRAFQRGVESLMMSQLVDLALSKDRQWIRGSYVPTEKNKVIEKLYENLGFQRIQSGFRELNCAGYLEKEHQIETLSSIS